MVILEALIVGLIVLTLWALLWTWVDARRERRYLESVRRHPSSLGAGACRCGTFALQYDGQQLLDQVDDQVHTKGWCAPVGEWLPPGR